MTIKRELLEAAASAGMLKYGQIDNLLVFLVQQELKLSRQAAVGRFNATFFYYIGGMALLAAMFWLASMIVTVLGATGLLWCAGLYGVAAIGGAYWAARHDMGLVASFFALIAIALAGCAVFAVQSMQGSWSGGLEVLLAREVLLVLDDKLLAIGLATLSVSLGLMLWLRLPFLVLPSAAIAWSLGLDTVPLLMMKANSAVEFGLVSSADEIRLVFTLLAGLLLMGMGLIGDLRRKVRKHGFVFWSYFAGLLAFNLSLWQLAQLTAQPMVGQAIFAVLQLGLILAGLVLGRHLFELFGAVGIALLLGEMAWTMLRDSPAFVPALTAISMVMLAVALWCWRRERIASARVRRKLPKGLRAHLMARQA